MTSPNARESPPDSSRDDGGGPLEGLTVLDLSRVLTGPYAAMLLGDLGARVIKVERPGIGDETRGWGPPFVGTGEGRTSTYFLSVNRNKESIGLDLRDADDREVLQGLVRKADILVENFRPGVLDRLGLGHRIFQDANPRLIVVSISGFGHDGPSAQRAGYDQIIQGEAGLMSMTGPDAGQPTKVGVPIADLSAGMFGVIGALAALDERHRTGRGRVVHTSLLGSLIGMHTFQGTRWLLGKDLPEASGNSHPTVSPYGAYRCSDGELVQIAVGNQSLWNRFAPAVGIDADDPRFATNEARREHEGELDALVEAAFGTRPAQEWTDELEGVGVPTGVIRTLEDVYADPQVISQGLVADLDDPRLGPLKVPGSPIRWDDEAPGQRHRPAPLLDEHGEQLRRWATHDH
ncbi:CaiB/BaiF CoA transferase family protein [Aeromicrobium piscarium]|uniref:CoA transferase n=1 Tax=Aeromicrobium piscarium TaxID=2590901 RepID=A0A554SH46_9ACTN|nr:CoA transferase [Aeromicrobium piscarium]TSD65672.1 CoA transferase [Aeromicrobium piscarium]